MKRIKDFIYDTNDILIAILILAIAAVIIMWRMNVILDYPSKLFGTGSHSDQTVTEPIDENQQSPSDVITTKDPLDHPSEEIIYSEIDPSEIGENEGQSEDVQGSEAVDEPSGGDDDSNASGQTESQGALWSADGKLTRTVVVDIEGNSASQAANCMVNEGLFEDYKEYARVCDDNGLNPEKIAAGRFTFSAGTTKAGIVKQVNWG